MSKEYNQSAAEMRDKLNEVSPSFCLAKWLQCSISLPQGMTQSCYHPPAHIIPLSELKKSVSSLHNTEFKKQERKQMLSGERPAGCSYCWKVEDAKSEDLKGHLSDRHYRSSEWWAETKFNEVSKNSADWDVTPRYVEVNFNQSCNFKCMYCSPHLSTSWEEEIKQQGPYHLITGAHNNIDALEAKGMMPIKVANKDNPYVQAFWSWWPKIYRDLRVFRMTGGEPLMDKNTFNVLDYVNENPHGYLELSITSNMCPPDQKLFDKFLSKVKKLEEIRTYEDTFNFNENSGNNWYVAPAFKHFMLFASVDGIGKQAEYMRTGLDFERFKSNVRKFLSETKFTSVSFINTFNLLSISTLRKFLEFVLELREEFGGRFQQEFSIQPESTHGVIHVPYVHKKFQRVWFDIPILRYPPWFSIQNAGTWGINIVNECIKYMEKNIQQDDYLDTFEGFKPYEILKVKRDLAIMEESLDSRQKELNQISFYQFINDFDFRRGTDFIETFPELEWYFKECALLANKELK